MGLGQEHTLTLSHLTFQLYKFVGLIFANVACVQSPSLSTALRGRKQSRSSAMTSLHALWISTWVIGRAIGLAGSVAGNTSGQNFTTSDFRENPKDSQQANPLWKVQTLIDELNEQASCMWLPGKFVAIDEQTIGFQGASGLNVRITYKREGDGFQCEAICDRGYTYAFWFRCAKPPEVPVG
jgi:hypothetical protein